MIVYISLFIIVLVSHYRMNLKGLVTNFFYDYSSKMTKRETFLSSPVGGAVVATISCVLWGSAFPVIKLSFAEIGLGSGDISYKIAFAGVRFTLAGLLLFLYWGFVRRKSHKKKEDIGNIPWKIFGLGVLQTTFQYSLFYVGLSRTSGMKSSIISGLGTLILAVLSHFYYKNDKLTVQKIIGIAIGFSSIIWINMGSGFSWTFQWLGEGLLLLTAISGAVSTIIAKELGKTYSPLYITATQMTFGGVLLLLIGRNGIIDLFSMFTPSSYILLFYSILISAIGFTLWFSLLQYQKAGDMAVFRLVIPVSGSILSAVFLASESFSLSLFAGLASVVVGIMFATIKIDRLIKKE